MTGLLTLGAKASRSSNGLLLPAGDDEVFGLLELDEADTGAEDSMSKSHRSLGAACEFPGPRGPLELDMAALAVPDE